MTDLNPFTLAAENSPKLLPLLRSQPQLASSQDSHGYSLLHAAASYNHLDLLRALVSDFHVDINLRDEDGETALFVIETVEAAQMLCEDFKIDQNIKNDDGETAEEKISNEGDFTTVADYLRTHLTSGNPPEFDDLTGDSRPPPPLPPNVRMQVGTLEDPEMLGDIADPSIRRRIEELAGREDFQDEDGQRQLKELVKETIRGIDNCERDVRPRLE